MNEAGVENSEKKPVQDKENGEKASSEGIQKRISLRRGKKLMVNHFFFFRRERKGVVC